MPKVAVAGACGQGERALGLRQPPLAEMCNKGSKMIEALRAQVVGEADMNMEHTMGHDQASKIMPRRESRDARSWSTLWRDGPSHCES